MGTPQSFCEENEDELKGLAKALVAPKAVEVAGAASALLRAAGKLGGKLEAWLAVGEGCIQLGSIRDGIFW